MIIISLHRSKRKIYQNKYCNHFSLCFYCLLLCLLLYFTTLTGIKQLPLARNEKSLQDAKQQDILMVCIIALFYDFYIYFWSFSLARLRLNQWIMHQMTRVNEYLKNISQPKDKKKPFKNNIQKSNTESTKNRINLLIRLLLFSSFINARMNFCIEGYQIPLHWNSCAH